MHSPRTTHLPTVSSRKKCTHDTASGLVLLTLVVLPTLEPDRDMASSRFFISSCSFFSIRSAAFSRCSFRMYSFADSTVEALLLLLLANESSLESLQSATTSSGLPSPSMCSLPFPCAGLGRSDCISFNASLIRFLRPCSATLWDVRFDVSPVDRDSG